MVFYHGGLPAQNNGSGIDVTLNLEVSSKAAECEFDLVSQFRRNGVWTRSSPHLNLGGWSSRLTDLAAVTMRANVCSKYCGLIQMFQSSR